MNLSLARSSAEAEGGLVDNAMRAVNARIKAERLRVGDVVPLKTAFANALGVSRTAVREAFRALAALGVLQLVNGRRARVGSSTGTRAFSGSCSTMPFTPTAFRSSKSTTFAGRSRGEPPRSPRSAAAKPEADAIGGVRGRHARGVLPPGRGDGARHRVPHGDRRRFAQSAFCAHRRLVRRRSPGRPGGSAGIAA